MSALPPVAQPDPRRRLFVLSGGGAPGIDIHVGSLLAAVHAFGAKPTTIIGTSAGAVVGALLAACNGDAYAVQQTIAGLRDRDFRADRFAWKLRLAWVDYILNPASIQRLLEKLLPDDFADLDIAFECVACDVMTNEAQYFGAVGYPAVPLRAAVQASMSIRGVWPEMEINDRLHSDGGTVDNLPLPDNWQDYEEVWLFIAAPPYRYEPAHRNALYRLLSNMNSRAEDAITDTLRVVRAYRGNTKVVIVRPDVGRESNLLEFDHGLMIEARDQAMVQIQAQLNERMLGPS